MSTKFTPEEDLSLLRFLANNPSIAELSLMNKFERFREEVGSQRTSKGLYSRFKKIVNTIHLTDLDVDAKLNLYFTYKILPNQEFLAEVREDNGVIVDNSGLIVRYNGMVQDQDSGNEEEQGRGDLPANGGSNHQQDEETVNSTHNGDAVEEDAGNGAGGETHAAPEEAVAEVKPTAVPKKRLAENAPLLTAKVFKSDPSSSSVHNTRNQRALQISSARNEMPTLEVEQDTDSASQNVSATMANDFVLSSAAMDSIKKSIAEQVKESFSIVLEAHKKQIEEKKTARNLEPVNLKTYFTDLKSLVNNLNSPHMVNIQKRIDTAIENLNDTNKTVPMETIHAVLDIGLKMFDY